MLTPVTIPAGEVTVYNQGKAPTFLELTLSSTSSNPWVQSNTVDGRITLDGSVPGGTRIDFLNRKTFHPSLGRQEMARIPRKWFAIMPGANVLTSNVSWSGTFRSAWF